MMSTSRILTIVITGLALALLPSAPLHAAVKPCRDYYCVSAIGGGDGGGGGGGGGGGTGDPPTWEELFDNADWESVNQNTGGALGLAAAGCVGDLQECQPDVDPRPLPQITPGVILTAFQRVPVPKLRSVSQPGDKTLVNFDTIFYTEAPDVRRSVTLLGQRVDLDITPLRYTWHHGDGTATTTAGPGGRYPDKSVTYRYQRAHVTVAHYVVVTWGARFRVNGGPWGQVPGTVTTTGPATGLRIAEATPVLVGAR